MTAPALTVQLRAWIDRLFPDPERGERLAGALEQRFGADARPVTEDLCREVETVAHEFSRHFALEYVADGSLVPDAAPPGWPPQDPREVRSRGASVGEVRRTPDGAGVLAVDSLDSVHLAAPYLEAAFALVRGARGVVLDLRRNGGGDPGTVTLILDWLIGGEPAHISTVVYRDRTRQWWTTGRLAELSPPPEMPVIALIGEGTFSSGEALAYHLQSQGKARLVGQPTPGAADHITPVRLTTHVRGFLPEARVQDAVTGSNWEGTGVIPDIPCEPEHALDAAIQALGPGG
jgi:Peptidase family S41